MTQATSPTDVDSGIYQLSQMRTDYSSVDMTVTLSHYPSRITLPNSEDGWKKYSPSRRATEILQRWNYHVELGLTSD